MQLLEIPYERQEGDRMCGAASLCMVYRSFGLACAQGDLWPHLQTADGGRARRGARSQALIRHALQLGFPAVLVRAARPWQLLGRCFAPDLRVLVMHRRGYDSFGLHVSVLRGLDDARVVLHDPYGRPDRHLWRDDFLALWGPHPWDTFGRGYLLAVIGSTSLAGPTCGCGQAGPEAARCPHCLEAVPLQPSVASGCGRADCPELDWDELFCPSCDGCLTRSTFSCLPPSN